MLIHFSRQDPRAFADQISTPSLGDHSYLIVVDDQAVAVDPQIDVKRFEQAIHRHNAKLVAVLETHIHNDYVSGGSLLARRNSARYFLPAKSEATVTHDAIEDGEAVAVGPWQLRAVHTPGHTPHHTSYALESSVGPVALFTGGCLLVGAVGRTDLVSPDLTESLTHSQYRSVHRLAREYADPTTVGPTHGAGSFCSGGSVTETVSTIGDEKRQNPVLLARDEDRWVAAQMAGYGLFPAYYPQMGPLNRAGNADAAPINPPTLSTEQLASLAGHVWIVDLRDAKTFAQAHVPGSLNIPRAQDAGVYVGWTLPWGEPMVLVGARDRDVTDVLSQLRRLGIRNVVGRVDDGLAAWTGEHRPVASYEVTDFQTLAKARAQLVIDARDPVEFRDGAVPGARNIHFSQALRVAAELSPKGVTAWVYCASGYRAAIAASVFARAGRSVVAVVDDVGKAKTVPPGAG